MLCVSMHESKLQKCLTGHSRLLVQLQDELQVAYVQEFYQVEHAHCRLCGIRHICASAYIICTSCCPATALTLLTCDCRLCGTSASVRVLSIAIDMSETLFMPAFSVYMCTKQSSLACSTDPMPRAAEKCVTKPSSSLGSSEQQCIARCADRYSEARTC